MIARAINILKWAPGNLPAAQLVRVMPIGMTCYAGTAPSASAGEPPDGAFRPGLFWQRFSPR